MESNFFNYGLNSIVAAVKPYSISYSGEPQVVEFYGYPGSEPDSTHVNTYLVVDTSDNPEVHRYQTLPYLALVTAHKDNEGKSIATALFS